MASITAPPGACDTPPPSGTSPQPRSGRSRPPRHRGDPEALTLPPPSTLRPCAHEAPPRGPPPLRNRSDSQPRRGPRPQRTGRSAKRGEEQPSGGVTTGVGREVQGARSTQEMGPDDTAAGDHPVRPQPRAGWAGGGERPPPVGARPGAPGTWRRGPRHPERAGEGQPRGSLTPQRPTQMQEPRRETDQAAARPSETPGPWAGPPRRPPVSQRGRPRPRADGQAESVRAEERTGASQVQVLAHLLDPEPNKAGSVKTPDTRVAGGCPTH